MRNTAFEPARPLDTDGMPWIPTGPGTSFRPLRFAADGWSELMRLEPGSAVAVHRHTGDVHAFKVAGTIEYLGDDGQVIESVIAESQRGVPGLVPAAQLSG